VHVHGERNAAEADERDAKLFFLQGDAPGRPPPVRLDRFCCALPASTRTVRIVFVAESRGNRPGEGRGEKALKRKRPPKRRPFVGYPAVSG
jgi:hypothetical protein